MRVPWTRAHLDLFGTRARNRLVRAGWGQKRHTVDTTIDALLPGIGDDVAGLLRLALTVTTSGNSDRQDDDCAPRRVSGGDLALTDPLLPRRWRPDFAAERWIDIDDHTRLSNCDPRFGWWLSQLMQAPGCATATTLWELREAPRDGWQTLHRRAFTVISAGVRQAADLTVGQEIAQLAAAASRTTRDIGRMQQMIDMRYGLHGEPHSLDEVAARFGDLSRQAVHITLQRGASLCGARTYAPALRRLLLEVEALGAGVYQQREDSLRTQLGPGQTLDGAIRFAVDFLGASSSWKVVPSHSGTNAVAMWDCTRTSNFDAVLRISRRLANRHGAVHWSFVAAAVSNEANAWVRREEFDDVLNSHPLHLWLDRASGWFSFSDINDSRLHRDLRDILQAAGPHPVTLGSMFAGACRAHGGNASDPMPPLDVVAALLETWLEVTATASGFRLVLSEEETSVRTWSPKVAMTIAAIKRSGGVAPWEELRSHLVGNVFDSERELSDLLETLPIIEQLGSAWFAIRGATAALPSSRPSHV